MYVYGKGKKKSFEARLGYRGFLSKAGKKIKEGLIKLDKTESESIQTEAELSNWIR